MAAADCKGGFAPAVTSMPDANIDICVARCYRDLEIELHPAAESQFDRLCLPRSHRNLLLFAHAYIVLALTALRKDSHVLIPVRNQFDGDPVLFCDTVILVCKLDPGDPNGDRRRLAVDVAERKFPGLFIESPAVIIIRIILPGADDQVF